MKIKTFHVNANIPKKLSNLQEMSNNMSFTWHYEMIELFRRLDPVLWENINHNPKKLLNFLSQTNLDKATNDESFISYINDVYKKFQDYFSSETWFYKKYPQLPTKPSIAYFSMEYGIDECMPIYSGGLGILAGDHLKSASDLGLPLCAIGLLYRKGYFKQYLNSDGWQQESYPENDVPHLPVAIQTNNKAEPLIIEVPMLDHVVYAQIWCCNVGKVPLYLLDTNINKNKVEDRYITAQLYGGNQEMRVKQEILIGIGGVKALSSLGIQPNVYHMNEGHSAFLTLERIRTLMNDHNLSLQEAQEFIKHSNVFTTHTPVPAGNDRFPMTTVSAYLKQTINDIGISEKEFAALGRENPHDEEEPFCMTVLAIKLANHRNGVSALHGDISRKMWEKVWPDVPEEDIPIKHITNGVHIKSWTSHDLAALLDLYLGINWGRNPQVTEIWDQIHLIPDIELWGTHERRRERLVAFARRRLVQQLERRGAPQIEIDRAQEILNPKTLTIGFAKRFATYKRATLIFKDIEL